MSFALLSGLVLLCSFIIGLCVFYLITNKQSETGNEYNPSIVEEIPLIVGERFRILSSQQLIQELALESALNNIRANLGLSDENWQKDALPFLHNYIAFVQRLPASESHHHAGDGGLVKHTLDVAALALIASTAQSWPPNAKTEEIAQKTSAWRYGIMCAAILHDVGKTLTNFHIDLYQDSKDPSSILWLPDAGSMLETGRQFYRVSFPDKKIAYAVHAEIAWTFFQAIVPSHVRQWLTETDSALMLALRGYLSGNKENNPLHQIITKADMTSVARDLKSGSRQRFSTATRTPWIEIIMETLREMLAQRGTYFSIANNAGGDLFRQGNDIYMMSKNVPDYIRQYLKNNNHTAAPSFPTDNQRIFDTLLEYGAVIPDSFDERRAVKHIQVVFTRNDGTQKDTIFSVLHFKLETLFPNESDYPAEFKGILNPITAPIQSNEATKSDSDNTQTTQVEPVSKVVYAPEPNHFLAKQSEQENRENHTVQVVVPPPPSLKTVAESTHIQEAAPAEKHAAEQPEPVKKTSMAHIEIPKPPKTSKKRDETDKKEPIQETRSTEITTTTPTSPTANIDDLLNKYQLLDDEPIVTQADDNNGRDNHAPSPAPIPETVTPPKPTEKPQEKEDMSESNHNKKRGNALMAELFGKTKTEPPPSNTLPTEDLAQTGFQEIEAQRQQLPTNTPRPVAIHQTPNLDEIQAAEQLSGSIDDVVDEQSNQKPHNRKPKQTPNMEETTEMNLIESIQKELREHGAQFLNWLANGLADGSIEVNNSRAPVHFIDKGMLLVTPAIFKEYAGGVFNKNEPKSVGVMAQRGFEQLKLHERTRRSAIYRAITTKDNNKKLFYCYLIPEHNIRHIIQPSSRPQNNTDITLHIDEDLLKLNQ